MAEAVKRAVEERYVKEIEAESVPTQQATERLVAIDRAKGLGIALVVWGHLATGATPGLPTWFYISVEAIYSFHMPLFMYLSGFVFFLSRSEEKYWNRPLGYVWKRFDRLMIPCVAFAIVAILGKYFVYSNYPFSSLSYFIKFISESALQAIKNTQNNPVLSIWYLIVLFVYSITVPIISRFLPFPTVVLCAIGVFLWLFDFTDKYYIERIAHYLLFFAVGGLVATYRRTIVPRLSTYYILCLLIFAVCCLVTLNSEWALLISGLASIPALHGLFVQKFWKYDKLFLFLGKNSMAIYLLNTIAIGVAQIVYTRYLPYQGTWFFLYLPFAFLCGLLAPIVMRSFLSVNERLRVIKRYID